MGYAMAIGPCLCCRKTFGYNPLRVPSLNGEPVCKECIDQANPRRVVNGLPPITYASDAYGPVDESEL